MIFWLDIMKLFPKVFKCWTLTNICFLIISENIQNYIHGLWIVPFSFVGICVSRNKWFPLPMCLKMYFHPGFSYLEIISIKIRGWYTILTLFIFFYTCTFLWNHYNLFLWLSHFYYSKYNFQQLKFYWSNKALITIFGNNDMGVNQYFLEIISF